MPSSSNRQAISGPKLTSPSNQDEHTNDKLKSLMHCFDLASVRFLTWMDLNKELLMHKFWRK